MDDSRIIEPRRLAIYQSADEQTAAFSAATGLSCPTGCGHCCANHNPHVSVADMVPIARALVDGATDDEAGGNLLPRGLPTAESVYERAVAAGDSGACVFFVEGRLPGGCTQYPLRPLLCRLFGFAAVRSKHGSLQLAVCHVFTERTPELAESAAQFVQEGGAVASFADLQEQVDALDPDRSREQLPINVALVRALERELLRAQYASP